MMRGTDGDRHDGDEVITGRYPNTKDPGAWAYKELVLYNFDMAQPLIGPVPAKVNLFNSQDCY